MAGCRGTTTWLLPYELEEGAATQEARRPGNP
jgi:hypothetical protein